MHTPYDHLTDAEFSARLERQEASDLLNSMIKRLAAHQVELDAARAEGYDEGYDEGVDRGRRTR
jgi:flagellar biosynthesis/type III secretory pathway protein FliH